MLINCVSSGPLKVRYCIHCLPLDYCAFCAPPVPYDQRAPGVQIDLTGGWRPPPKVRKEP